MSRNPDAVLLALTIPCFTCGSASGEPCVTNVRKRHVIIGRHVTDEVAYLPVGDRPSKPCKPHSTRVQSASKKEK